jgi:hypothetical protein
MFVGGDDSESLNSTFLQNFIIYVTGRAGAAQAARWLLIAGFRGVSTSSGWHTVAWLAVAN